MKTNRIFFLAAALSAVVALTSCGKNETTVNTSAPVRFSAAIAGQALPGAATRAEGTTWASGDAVGIFMVNHGLTTIAENAGNRQYTTTGDGNFTAVAGDEIYYPMDGSAVDFIAWYPYSAGAALGTPVAIPIATTQTAANQPDFDLLYATANNSGNGYTKTTSGAVALAFSHKLSKLVLNTTADPSVGVALTGMTVKITGMNTAGTFDLSTGALGTTGTPAAITPRTITDGASYDAIILPGSYAAGALTVEFTIGSGSGAETFVWNVGAITFDSGSQYTYDLTLKRTGVTVTGSITPWTPVASGSGTAE